MMKEVSSAWHDDDDDDDDDVYDDEKSVRIDEILLRDEEW